jgi:hypothetical protein
VWLHASFPGDYPDVPPSARLSLERGLTGEQLEELRAELAKAIEVRAAGGMGSSLRCWAAVCGGAAVCGARSCHTPHC